MKWWENLWSVISQTLIDIQELAFFTFRLDQYHWEDFFWGEVTLPETNSNFAPVKMDGWKMNFLLGPGLF